MQAPPTIVERNFVRPMPVPMAPPGPLFEMEPEYLEQVVEIPRVNIEHRERLVEIPQPQVVDRIVEVPQIQEIIKELPGGTREVPVTREAPVIEFQLEKLAPMEITQVEYTDRYMEVPQIHEVVRVIPRIEVREIPIERIIQVPKKIIQEIERPIYRPIPHLVQQQVERQIPVPKVQMQQLEVVKQVPYPVNQDVDVQVNYPMPVPVAPPPPMAVGTVPVPVPTPVPVEVERRVDVPQVQTQVIEKIVEVPVAVPVERPAPPPPVQTVQTVPVIQERIVSAPPPPPVTIQTGTIIEERINVKPPVTVGPGVTVGSRVIGTSMATPPTSYVGPPSTPPRMISSQVVAPYGNYAPVTTSYGAGAYSSVIGPSQRVGGMTPPTPPVATRPSLGGYSSGYIMPAASAPIGGPRELVTAQNIGTLPSGVPTPPMPPASTAI